MLDALAEFTKSLLIPGTLTFLLFVLTIGLGLAYGPRRTRRFSLPLLTVLAISYWLAGIPAIADTVATRFHAANSRLATREDLAGIRAIVVLGAGIRTSYSVAGHTMVVPDPQTIYNAVEAARIYHLLDDQLPVVASGGRQDGAEVEFVTITRFDDMAAVRAFAGEDYELAVIAPDARPLLTHYDARSVHYETVFTLDD